MPFDLSNSTWFNNLPKVLGNPDLEPVVISGGVAKSDATAKRTALGILLNMIAIVVILTQVKSPLKWLLACAVFFFSPFTRLLLAMKK